MSFTAGEMVVFDRSGARIGTIAHFNVVQSRSYKTNDIDDFTIEIPYRDDQGATVYDSAMAALLAEDNHLYVENELDMPGWGGFISSTTEGNDRVQITCLGGLGLFADLHTDRIHQSGGTSSQFAGRLVAAAAAKQGAHGDLVPTLVIDGDTTLPGIYEWEGDILQGLDQLISDALAEVYVQAVVSTDGLTLGYELHWNAEAVTVDHSDIVIHDGAGGQLKSGPTFLNSGLEVVNHAIMRGVPTQLGQYIDYAAVRGVITDITPQIEVTLDAAAETNWRRREDLNLSVNFSYPETIQKALAGDIQQRYVDYYKTFLYAYHQRQGKPYLDGFDWSGPDSTNEATLTEDRYRTVNKLGRIGGATVITAETDSDVPLAAITDWSLDGEFDALSGGYIQGIALDYTDTSRHWLLDYDSNRASLLEDDYATIDDSMLVGNASTSAEHGVGVATDPNAITSLWSAMADGSFSSVTIRTYDIESHALVSQFTVAYANGADLAVDVTNGLLYLVNYDNPTIDVRDLNGGTLLTTINSQIDMSGSDYVTGLTVSGGVIYVGSWEGHLNILDATTGHLLGTFSAHTNIGGALLADPYNQRFYFADGESGVLVVYHALVAIAQVDAPGSVDGAPGFDTVLAGQFVHIVETNDVLYSPTHSAGASTTYTVKSGDTLWGIALHYYGSGSSWPTIYDANKAHIIAVAESHGFTSDFAHWIFPGEVLTIPGPGGTATPAQPAALSRGLVVYTPGKWDTEIVPGPVGEPAILQRSWDETGPQVVGFAQMGTGHCLVQAPNVVIQGEEGRVDDWQPSSDGYGVYKVHAYYRLSTGSVKDEGPGWYPHDWDVPSANWTAAQQDWPEGVAYLTDYLNHRNRTVTVQSIEVTNVGGLWSKVRQGALFTLQTTQQGPVDTGITKTIRVLAFSPNEMLGTMEIVAEEWP